MAVGSCSNKKVDWFKPTQGQVVLFRTELKSHSEQQFELKSKESLQLYMETNASYELMQKYHFASHLPVRLEHKNGIDSLATVKGAGGGLFPPIDGVIPLTLKNETEETLQIVICSEPKS